MNKKKINSGFYRFYLYFIVFIVYQGLCLYSAYAESEKRFNPELPKLAIENVRSSDFSITAEEKSGDVWQKSEYNGPLKITGLKSMESGESPLIVNFESGTANLSNVAFTADTITLEAEGWQSSEHKVFIIPGFLSVVPPIIAIILALIFRNVILSLFSGIWFGVMVLYHYNPVSGLMHSFDQYILDSIADRDHASIMLFSLTLGGMISIVASSGGIQGIISFLTKYANNRKMGQFTTWLMGMLIFFDDYANTLLVGNTMRSYTDNLKVSREKLSFIVDSTSAPVAGLAIISTWIGFELGQIDAGMNIIGTVAYNAYDILIASLPYNFYSIFMIIFVMLVALQNRDFGPMLKAEKRAYLEGKVLADGANPLIDSSMNPENFLSNARPSASNALIPVFSVILITIIGIIYTGLESMGIGFSQLGLNNIRDIIGSSNPYVVLLWAALGGTIIAGSMVVARGVLTMEQTIEAWVGGVKSMMLAIIILILAWTLSGVASELNTNYYIISLIGNNLPLWALPTLIFVLSGATSFATGTSYGTMGILFPLVIPLTYAMLGDAGIVAITGTEYHPIFLGVIGSVLAGALFGDHCSPISDTTVMSSMASGADHIDHVRTQIPYALTVGVTAILFGYLPSSFGISPFILIPIGVLLLMGILKFVGKNVEQFENEVVNKQKEIA